MLRFTVQNHGHACVQTMPVVHSQAFELGLVVNKRSVFTTSVTGLYQSLCTVLNQVLYLLNFDFSTLSTTLTMITTHFNKRIIV